MIIYIKDPLRVFKGKRTAVISPGLTLLAGAERSGKTTFLNEIAKTARIRKLPLIWLDNNVSSLSAYQRDFPKFAQKKYFVLVDNFDIGKDTKHIKDDLRYVQQVAATAKQCGVELYVLLATNSFTTLCHATTGETIFIPIFRHRKSPCYTVRQYSKYEEDIELSSLEVTN